MTQEVVCPACGAAVPQGRLSCQECGTMLASVAGTANPPPARVAAVSGVVNEEVAATADVPSAIEADAVAVVDTAETAIEPETAAEPELETMPAAPDAVDLALEEPPPAAQTVPHEPPPIMGEWTGPPPAISIPDETPMPAGPAMSPSSVTVMGAAGTRRRFGEPLYPTGGPQTPDEAAAQAQAQVAEETSTATQVIAAPTAISSWLVVAGGFMAGISFLLPWAEVVLGGNAIDESYMGEWGLANAPNILLLIAAFIVGWLPLAPTNRFVLLRTGAIPILAGGLLLGVAWPYVLGPYGPQLGMWLMLTGATLLLVGGFWSLVHVLRDGRTGEADEGS